MNDLISRQAAIDAINSYFGFNTEEEYGSAVQEVINGLPSAQPEPDWDYSEETKQITLTVPEDVYDSAETIFLSVGYEGTFGIRGMVYSAQSERCSDCIAHGGDWECDHIHCRKGRLPSAQINCIVNNDIHLCDSCKYSYPSCPSSKFDVVFGDSVGHDNICACNKYQPRYDEEWRKLHYESSYSQGFLEGVRMCEQTQPKQKLGKWVDDGDPLS